MPLLIGVVGLIGSGKGSVGDYLTEKYDFKQDSFANPLKDAVSAIFGWPRHLLEGNTKESREFREIPDEWWENALEWKNQSFFNLFPRFTPRVCLQLFGTEIMRKAFHDNIWILSLQNRIRSFTCNTVITDCRFPNELNALKNQDSIIIRVKRGLDPSWYNTAELANTHPSSFNQYTEAMYNTKMHQSEWAWVGYNFDYILNNNGTLEELYSIIDNIIGDLC